MNKKRRNTLKKAITLMLAMVMVFTSVPVNAGSLGANSDNIAVTASTEDATSVTETEVMKEDSTGVDSADQESEDKNEENSDSNADVNQEIKEEAGSQTGEKSESEAQVKAVAFAEGREAEVAPVVITDITVNAEGDIYVAPKATGDGSSKENPTEFTAALKALKPGKTIFMADGTYKYSEMIVIDKDNCGTADAMKSVKAENANKVTL
ncbi:MAG: hypothetical protein HUJ70_04800, partial [Pseudobutyrivibrio sp.]|nr:hypothetical protein [Pseudobutyrivibrio sp.]